MSNARKPKNIRYRLALKLGSDDEEKGKSALAFAVMRLPEQAAPELEASGQGPELPPAAVEKMGEGSVLRVVVYESEADMIEPMPKAAFDARLEQILQELPPGVVLEKVLFDRARFDAWRAGRPDSHQTRAEWVNTLEFIH